LREIKIREVVGIHVTKLQREAFICSTGMANLGKKYEAVESLRGNLR
jgi:hypothetical protein